MLAEPSTDRKPAAATPRARRAA
ncbi:MAG: hypothetical protein RI960_1467, partial [Pseudomonadota bacterium]